VVPEIFGVHAYLEDVCRRFAQAGFYALAPEIFFRHSEPGQYATVAAILENVIAKMDDQQVMADLDKCVEFAGSEGADVKKLAITGFCWGGRITWLYAAHQPAVKAGVAWYGRLVGAKTELTPAHPVDVASKLKAPVLGLYGSEDSSIPLDTVEQMRKALAAAEKIHLQRPAASPYLTRLSTVSTPIIAPPTIPPWRNRRTIRRLSSCGART